MPCTDDIAASMFTYECAIVPCPPMHSCDLLKECICTQAVLMEEPCVLSIYSLIFLNHVGNMDS